MNIRQRPGAIAIYLDIWHEDVIGFMDLKLNNGDERLRAHDIFPALSIPDLFMEKLIAREKWYLFDPYSIEKFLGFRLEDYYDEEKGKGSFRDKYMECVNHPLLPRVETTALDIAKRYMRSQLETGTPFMFFRDTVNRMNPNKHEGMIYSSNLCTEIAQNMSATEEVDELLMEDGNIAIIRRPGDFVVCNLTSLNLPRCVELDVLAEATEVAVRSLDATIDLNNLPNKQSELTNKKYRALGVGTLGWDNLRAVEGLDWESDEILEYVDKLHEKIAYHGIKASMELAKEKGAYELFEGSDWQTGEYFTARNYFDEGDMTEEWKALAADVKEHGMRNAYLFAIAPNSTTSNIMGTSASIDPYFQMEWVEENKIGRLPTVVSDINPDTIKKYHESAWHVNQHASVSQNAVRQRHVDQAISFNLYIPNDIKASVILKLQTDAWDKGIKTIYYHRSTATKIDNCEWCHA